MTPADAHVHSQWSWDSGSDPSSPGRMARTCARAERIGLTTLVFTEHLDLDDRWYVDDGDLGEHAQRYVGADGVVRVPPFDVDGYLADVERCRHRHPGLRILTGVEFGQPHLWAERAAPLLSAGAIDRVNGSLHTLPWRDGRAEPVTLYRHLPADAVVTAYLEELPRMIASDAFDVLTHIDYAARTWPAAAGPFDPLRFEEGFRAAMRVLAATGRPLELNTRGLAPWIPRWWAEEGGGSVVFGSDAHVSSALARHFPEATAMAARAGFRAGDRPEDPWTRAR